MLSSIVLSLIVSISPAQEKQSTDKALTQVKTSHVIEKVIVNKISHLEETLIRSSRKTTRR